MASIVSVVMGDGSVCQPLQRRALALAFCLLSLGGMAVWADESQAVGRFHLGTPALDFDAGNYVHIGNDAALNPREAITLEAWINPRQDNQAIIWRGHSGTGSGDNAYAMMTRRNQIRVRFGGSQLHVGRIRHGQWTHVAATFDRGEIRVYQDGELVGRESHGSSLRQNEQNTVIGIREHNGNPSGAGHSTWVGLIRDVRIWDRARTQEEIAADRHRMLTGNEQGLVGYWRFDEGQGDTVRDRSPGNNHGEVKGASWDFAVREVADMTVGAGHVEPLFLRRVDAQGKPLTEGTLDNVVSVTGGRLAPQTVGFAQGEAVVQVSWHLDEPGEHALRVAYDGFEALTCHVTVTPATQLVIETDAKVVTLDRPTTFTVRVTDDEGRPVRAGAYQRLIAASGGQLDPARVDIGEGEAEVTFTWTPNRPGLYTLRAVHQGLAAQEHSIRAGVAHALQDNSRQVQVEALGELRRHGHEAFLESMDVTAYSRTLPTLIELTVADDVDDEDRQTALEVAQAMVSTLAQREDARAAALLQHVLRDADHPQLRTEAAQALGSMGHRGSVAELRRLLEEDNWRLRFTAHAALRAMGQQVRVDVPEQAMDWPMWRYSVNRGAATLHELPAQLHPQWVLTLPTPRRAWPWQTDDFDKLEFDLSYEPLVAGNLMYVPSMVNDSLAAYDIDTGRERWRYFTDGPIRVAPAIWDGRIYVPSDDGVMHCLDAATGEVVWTFQAAPSRRLVLGNERLISMWSIRGGPVIDDGTLYFAAGFWPHEGVFIYAVDAADGQVKWINSGTGSRMDLHQHGGAYAFGGVAPQGSFVLAGDRLIVPGGRTPPAVFDRDSGELLYFRHDTSTVGKGAGGYRVYAGDGVYFNPRVYENRMYNLNDGEPMRTLDVHVIAEGAYFGMDGNRIFGYEPVEQGDDIHWRTNGIDGLEALHVMAGTRLYGSGSDGAIMVIDLQLDPEPAAEVAWSATIEGDVFRMIAARDRLIVVTTQGRIYCFGRHQRQPLEHPRHDAPLTDARDDWAQKARQLLDESGMTDGYALMFGIGTGRLLDELIKRSDLHITAFDPDKDKVQQLRERYIRAGVYGSRVAVHQGDATTAILPPYIASLIVSEDPQAAGLAEGETFVRALFHPLRPYGGTAYLALSGDEQAAFTDAVSRAALEKADLATADDHVLLVRPGVLPNTDHWTHQYANAANATYSSDSRVRAPLGISWFGGTSNLKTLPRHLNGPIPHVVEGRLIILGVNHISARCVYTGRPLWTRELELVGEYFTSLSHERQAAAGRQMVYFPNHPGANFIGSPYVSTEDSVYIVHQDRCLRLDLDTGETLATFELPARDELPRYATNGQAFEPSFAARLAEGEEKRWGNIRVQGDDLVVAAYPHMFDDSQPGRAGNWNATSSEYLLVMDRHSGEIRWVRQARYGFRHNAMAVAEDRVFVLDSVSPHIMQQFERRGIEPDVDPDIHALDIKTGRALWRYDDRVFGTWLSYSAKHDVLMQAGRRGARQALSDEPRDQLLALRGADGEQLWRRGERHTGPIILHDDLQHVFAGQNERAVHILTGEPFELSHPITGHPELWRFNRTYGCGTQNMSRYIITFRSGAAGYYDLFNNSGVGNLAGFRSGCTNNMIVADGVLNAPEYTRSCSCSYQHQTSLAFVHMPDTEMWTYNTYADPDEGSIRRVGVNLGAPGSRVTDDGTLWVNHPRTNRVPTPSVPLRIDTTDDASWFGGHAMEIVEDNGAYRWVVATGIEGITRLRIAGLFDAADRDADHEPTTYTLRLHFAEPHQLGPGQRVFDVVVQGRTVHENLDIVAEAGGSKRGVMIEVPRVRPDEQQRVTIAFTPADGSERQPLLGGVELVIDE